MIQPAYTGNLGYPSIGSSLSGDYPKPPKRKPGRPRKGSSRENPIEIDDEKPRRATVRRNNARAKIPFPPLSRSSGVGSSLAPKQHSPVQRNRNTRPQQLSPPQNPGGVLPSGPQQCPQAVPGAANADHQQSAQLQTPGVIPTKMLGAVQQGQYGCSVKPPVSLQQPYPPGGVQVAQHSQDMNIHIQKIPQYGWDAPGQLESPSLQQMSGPVWALDSNHHPIATLDATTAGYQQLEPAPGVYGLPPTEMTFDGYQAPNDWLVDSKVEQQIVGGWLQDWQSGGLLSDTVEGPLFKERG